MHNPADAMSLLYLDESQNEAFDSEYHSEQELESKIAYIRRAFPDGPRRMLDIGGGNGKFMDRLLAEFPQAEGTVLDISQLLLDRNLPDPRKHLLHGSFEDLAGLVGSTRFDVVTINWVLHHLVGPSYGQSLNNIERALEAAVSVLTPEGQLIVAENEYQGFFGSNAPSRIIYGLTRIRAPRFVKLARRYFNTAGTGVCFQSGRRWRQIFHQAGLSVRFHQTHDRWHHGLKKQLMFGALLLRKQLHGHYGLGRG